MDMQSFLVAEKELLAELPSLYKAIVALIAVCNGPNSAVLNWTMWLSYNLPTCQSYVESNPHVRSSVSLSIIAACGCVCVYFLCVYKLPMDV